MNKFQDDNFLAIIIGVVIISGCICLGLKDNNQKLEIFVTPKEEPATISKQVLMPVEKTVNVKNVIVCKAPIQTIVTKVIDGDTVVVEGGYHVRLLGMDADENGYPCYTPAKNRLEGLVLGKQVFLEEDKTDTDQYGRCLRYIFIGSTNINVQLVKEGLAVARFYQPDIKYQTEITAAEKQAQVTGIGCKWSGKPQVAVSP